ncbi:NAD(P)-dependent dehydrogenase (short-subunit alcohol dehydrogenase family) [Paraburkholderia atlantica]|uniref:SDR family NAD(P)-dependent oxidoreductase n=1 Tax=Paraburkholderia atlantica TaxID=2654982 RepID=UPI0015908F16|nr:SDR family oxidoreductase [Paraburkholderia atlantica]NUY29266.1 SDR family oxidoreductase [Paraburkholderia atlantica]
MKRLDGKIALVMGASRAGNMGQAITRRFVDEGATVVIAGRSAEGLQSFAREIGAPVSAKLCDVASKSAVSQLVEDVVHAHGRLDIAVNAAATGHYGAFEETSEAEIDEMLSIIFKGGFFFMQSAVGAMKHSGGGSIINISSAVATIMFENHAAYMGAKAGLEHITRSVANEFGRFGIRANCIAPGLTETPMLGGFVSPGMTDAFIKEMPLGRLNTVEDIANAAVFVASDECFMTGQTLHVTGGLTLRRNPTAAEIAASVQAATR